LNKAYIQHILPFLQDDYIETNINIFTDKGLIDFNCFKWLNISSYATPKFNHLEFTIEHNKLREVIDFDLSRFCELEVMRNKWNDINTMQKNAAIVQNLKLLFEPYFIIQKIHFDDIGYFIFKLYLKANKTGMFLLK
jgi:hypothetical protein